MSYHYTILGAGRQGVALAYDLARAGEAGTIVLADADQKVALNAAGRLSRLLPDAKVDWRAKPCDVSDPRVVSHVIAGADVVLSAVPYRFNVELTRLAIEAGASFNDLGGNTDVVRGSLAQHEAAAAAGVSVVPDCGLAPGLGNILAAHAIEQLTRDGCTDIDVHVRCGGLPETPTGPLQYKLVFNFDGLINEYSGEGEFLRDGKPFNVPTLTEEESLSVDTPTGYDANGKPKGWQARQFEAAVTSGGTSTCAASFLGKVRTYDYKTIRYPGHFAQIRTLFGLGLLDSELRMPDGKMASPRAVTRALFEQRMGYPEVRDTVILRCEASGTPRGGSSKGERVTLRYDLYDRHDEKTGLTAMERTTAFPTALVAHLQARKVIKPGARPLELCLPLQQYMDELARHDVQIRSAKF